MQKSHLPQMSRGMRGKWKGACKGLINSKGERQVGRVWQVVQFK